MGTCSCTVGPLFSSSDLVLTIALSSCCFSGRSLLFMPFDHLRPTTPRYPLLQHPCGCPGLNMPTPFVDGTTPRPLVSCQRIHAPRWADPVFMERLPNVALSHAPMLPSHSFDGRPLSAWTHLQCFCFSFVRHTGCLLSSGWRLAENRRYRQILSAK